MMTAQKAWLVAGAVSLQGLAFAGEGSSLRGLKIPTAASETPAYTLSGSEPRLKRTGDDPLPDFGARIFLSGGTSHVRRLTTDDMDYRFGLHQPNGAYAPALSEPGISSLIETSPRYTLSTRVTRALPGGWGLGFGVRQSEYNFASANLLSFSAERAFGSFRGAYTLYSSRAEGTGLGSAHRFEVNYLYGERNSVGLSYTTGRDIDNLSIPSTLSLSDVRDWTLSGRHWLSPNWALTYDVLSQEQVLFKRQGLRMGVSRTF
jgi:YaiO family outer membrane protein